MKCNDCKYNSHDHGCDATYEQRFEIDCDIILDDSPMAYLNAVRQSGIFLRQYRENHESKGERNDNT